MKILSKPNYLLLSIFLINTADVFAFEKTEELSFMGLNDVIFFNGFDPSGLLINELDYDQESSDFEEFIEIYNPTSTTADLSNLSLVLVTGNTGAEYDRIALDTISSVLPAGEYLVIGNSSLAGVVPVGTVFIDLGINANIQNGGNDGDALALVNTATFQLIDSLSYGGSVTNADIMGFPMLVNLVEGNPTFAIDIGAGQSIIRSPDGADSGDDDSDFILSNIVTPGGQNPNL